MGCCEFGKQWQLDGKSCGRIPPKFATTLGGPSLCTTTATECCESTRAAYHCFYGYWDYNKLSSCSYDTIAPYSNTCNDRKSCCQCCQIGRRQYAEYGHCDQAIALPEPCKSSYLSCCVDSIDTSSPVIQVPSKPTRATTTTATTPRTTTSTTKVYITPRRSVCEQYGDKICDQMCIDLDGGKFSCECYEGYYMKDSKCVRKQVTCSMLNCEATSIAGPICQTNDNGDATCECLSGYKKIDNNSCVDIDECNHPDPYKYCSQGQNCINTMGSYKCNRPGFDYRYINR